MNKPVIGYAGLTHLGLNSAIASAARGFKVVGFHNDIQLVKNLNNGILHVLEPQLSELMVTCSDNLTFHSNRASLYSCDIVYISVDVPTDEGGVSSLTPVEDMIQIATSAMRKEAILIILCQVPPGFTRGVIWPAKQLVYQVETLIFGQAVERALNPERFILGLANPNDALPSTLTIYLGAFKCPILPMRYESAELAKISINMFLVASITTANTLAEICEKIGADWFEIMPALRLDKRIGPYAYLTPGLGISGGNLERDIKTSIDISDKYTTESGTLSACIKNSHYRKNWVWFKLNELILPVNPNPAIALLGLTYKENTNSIKNSPAFELISSLADLKFTAFDPGAPYEFPFAGVIRVETMERTLDNADVLIIMTPWEQFKTLSVSEITNRMKGRIIIDPYRILNGEELAKRGFIYASLGQTTQYDN
ncbi:nucleotide sugar dehydrogenase [Daejeonella sp.]|uniref:nucleotide sugar dehydrogenase n=1 Tax=Daejeonella sp. TaxID=2805397 RepID=UPI0030C00260